MSQVTAIVRSALERLRVIDADDPISAADMAAGIAELNRLMRMWQSEGIAIGWTDVAHASDAMPTDPEHDYGIIANLALSMRSRYGVSLDSDEVAYAREGKSSIMASVLRKSYDRLSYDLPRPAARSVQYPYTPGR